MRTICVCFCNLAGHGGQCLGDAEPGLRPQAGHPYIFPGYLCRACFEAVRPRKPSRTVTTTPPRQARLAHRGATRR